MFESIGEIMKQPQVKNMLEQRTKTESPIEAILLTTMAKWGLYPKTQISGSEIHADSDKIVISIIRNYFPEKWDEKKFQEYCDKPSKIIFQGRKPAFMEEQNCREYSL